MQPKLARMVGLDYMATKTPLVEFCTSGLEDGKDLCVEDFKDDLIKKYTVFYVSRT